VRKLIFALAIPLLSLSPLFGQQGQSENPEQLWRTGAGWTTTRDLIGLQPIKTEKAAYPQGAREKRIQGKVWVKVLITESGEVGKAEGTSGDPILVAAAVTAAKEWKFKPFIQDGKACEINAMILFNFVPSDESKNPSAQTEQVPSAQSKEAPGAAAAPAEFVGASADRANAEIEGKLFIPGLLVHFVKPVYPEEAKHHAIQGTVLLRGVIDTDGAVTDLKPVSGPPELTPAAIKAVKKWRYRPYMLNGVPLAVETNIQVNFSLLSH